MLQWFEQKCSPWRSIPAAGRPGTGTASPIGKLVDRDAPDFNTCYEALRHKSNGQEG